MKCEIIRDLLPAYCDGVCSEETAAEIKAHTAECSECRKMLKAFGSEIKTADGSSSAPEKPFKKIRGSIRRSKFISLMILIILIIVLSVIGYLSYGQLIRQSGHQSFETLFAAYNSKKLISEYCSGNLDYVTEKIIVWNNDSLFEYEPEIQKYAAKELRSFYKDYIEGNDITVTRSNDFDYEFYGTTFTTVPACTVFIQGDEIPAIAMYVFQEGYYNTVIPYPDTRDERWESEDHAELKRRVYQLQYALYPYPPLTVLEEKLFTNEKERDRSYEFVCEKYTDGSDREYSAKLYERINTLMDTEIICEDFSLTDYRFDSENERYLADIRITFLEPSTGKHAVYIRTAQVNDRIILLPEFQPMIIDEGISTGIQTQIEMIF